MHKKHNASFQEIMIGAPISCKDSEKLLFQVKKKKKNFLTLT